MNGGIVPGLQSETVSVEVRAQEPAKKEKKTLAQQVAKLEADFTYQYEYNEELIEKLRVQNDQLVHMGGKLRSEQEVNARNTASLHKAITNLQEDVERLSRPSKFWKKIAAVGWILAVLLGSALAYEKFVEPLDSLQSRVSILLSDVLAN